MLLAVAKRLEAQELRLAVAAALLALLPAKAAAQAAPATATVPVVANDPAVPAQAAKLIPLLAGGGDYAALFTPAFRQQVPRERFEAISKQLRDALGAPAGIERLAPQGRWVADAVIRYGRGSATLRLAVEPTAPHAISGLLVTGTERSGDTAAKLQADVLALPGQAQLGVYALDGEVPTPIMEVDAGRAAPIGSAFKLWVLAEAARQVAAGQRRWDEVVPVGPPSLPSGILQGWPRATPVTVQTLATLMISISDNTATDTLMAVLGRREVDAMAASFGAQQPVLTTREAFVIKADPELTRQWTATTAAGQRALLDAQASRITAAPIDPMMFSGKPLATDTVEWFASPRDMARLLAHLRDADEVVRGMLAINPGVDAGTAGRLAYVGFKGGSEPGVIALNLLVRTRGGRWYAVVGSWHRADAAVEDARFVGLVSRALALVAAR